MTRSKNHYHAWSIGAHWLTLALLVAVYALIELRGIFPKGTAAHEAMKTWHFMLGLTVLGVVAVRLALRLVFRAPPITPAPAAWVLWLAKAMYVALYAFLIAMPLLGWLTLSADGEPVPLFGLQLPALIAPNEALAENFEEIHETVGTIGYYLIGLHAAAALFHHYFMGDDTLSRMLPWRARGRRAGAQPQPLNPRRQ